LLNYFQSFFGTSFSFLYSIPKHKQHHIFNFKSYNHSSITYFFDSYNLLNVSFFITKYFYLILQVFITSLSVVFLIILFGVFNYIFSLKIQPYPNAMNFQRIQYSNWVEKMKKDSYRRKRALSPSFKY
jgi:hypothetical protein